MRLRTLLGDHPGTAALKNGSVKSDSVTLDFAFPAEDALRIEATVSVFARTGVEMEALTAVSVAALTVYDMCKAADRAMTIEAVRLEEKDGGKSGHFVRDPTPSPD